MHFKYEFNNGQIIIYLLILLWSLVILTGRTNKIEMYAWPRTSITSPLTNN